MTTTDPTDEIDTGEVVTQLWAGQRLSRVHQDHLSGAIGRGPAKKLTRQLAADRKAAKPRGFWDWMFGPSQSEPLPDSVARVVLRMQSGEPIGRADLDRLGRVVGRRAARQLQHHLKIKPRGGGRRTR